MTLSVARSSAGMDSYNRLGRGDSPGPEEEDETLEAVFDDYSGISMPLYEVADAIFNFPAQQSIRRRVRPGHFRCLLMRCACFRSSK